MEYPGNMGWQKPEGSQRYQVHPGMIGQHEVQSKRLSKSAKQSQSANESRPGMAST